MIASESLLDPNFKKSVVLIIQHGEDGALGLILNRPTETMLSEAWEQMSDTSCDNETLLRLGGPCEGPLMAVHTEQAVGQIEVFSKVYFSAQADQMGILVETGLTPTLYFVGYSGWSPEQLESELESGAWLTTPASAEHVFQTSNAMDLWDKVMKQISDSVLSPMDFKHVPDDPSMN